jgi:hypothetical protein
MTALTGPPATASRAPHGFRLRGLTWLIWRQHRATFWTTIGATVAGVGGIVLERARMTDYLDGHGWPRPKTDQWLQGFTPHAQLLNQGGYAIALVPVLLGVFLGAPLLAGDLENGTAKLIASQSVSRVRWLAAKLGISLGVVVVCTTALSLAFGWWWGPVRATPVVSWSDLSMFDSTGPMPTALALFTVAGGIAIGMLLRRVLMAMVVTFGFALAVQAFCVRYRFDLGRVTTVTTHQGVDTFQRLPPEAYLTDQSYLTASGRSLGWSTCSSEPTDKAHAACLVRDHIVGWSLEYLPFSRMSAMQWSGAAILLTLTAAVVAFVLLCARKRLA